MKPTMGSLLGDRMKRFREDDIRRQRLPWDVRGLLHDLCWHMEKTPIENYVQRAQEVMKAAKTPPRPKRRMR